MDVGEIKVVVTGEKFDKNLPVKGTISLTFPNGEILELDILDVLNTDWYEEIT